jgi:glycolate oxidase iron-sulfur subunit
MSPADEPGSRGIFDPALLATCISCGFCLPTCPTYEMTGAEQSSPRGRINLMRALETGTLDERDPTLEEESSFCLGCRACEPVCPAGVQYGQLLEQWRDHQWSGRHRPMQAAALTLLFGLPGRVLAIQRVFRRYAASRTADGHSGPSYLLGCAERGLFPSVSHAVRSLDPAIGIPRNQGCCGALHAHNGDSGAGAKLASRLGAELPGVIVTTSGGCAAHLAHHLGRERVQDISEHLLSRAADPVGLRPGRHRPRVAVQDSCHLRNGLGVWREPRQLLAGVADLVELPSAATCCGAAGTYALLRRRESRRIIDRKIDELHSLGVEYVVAVNPGCLRQLRQALRRRRSPITAVHLVELLAMQTSPAPTEIPGRP